MHVHPAEPTAGEIMHVDERERFIVACHRRLRQRTEQIQQQGAVAQMPACELTGHEAVTEHGALVKEPSKRIVAVA